MTALGVARDVAQTIVLQELERGTVGIVVEVASHHDLGTGRQQSDGTDEAFHDNMAIGTCLSFTTIATGGMNDEDVQRITIHGLPLHIQDVTRGAHAFQRRDIQVVVADRTKRKGLIEQGHINTTNVG